MVLELLGTRVIAPFYGTSLYVWSSLISVTMVALALGYFLGGRLADLERPMALPGTLFGGGVLTLLVPFIAPSLLPLTNALGLRWGALTSSLLLFLPGLTLLGMVGPQAIRLQVKKITGVGVTAGNIYAISTLGSVAGTLLLGFFLFPRVGSRAILLSTGGALVILAGLLLIRLRVTSRFGRGAASLLWISVLGMGIAAWVSHHREPPHPGVAVLQNEESLYGWVRVLDYEGKNLRILATDASVIGAGDPRTGETRLDYQHVVNQIPRVYPWVKSVLLIGQGAGHIASVLKATYGIDTDAIEIDPLVAKAAVDHFAFKPSGKTIIGDGRYEISRLKGPYDLIIHDCFTGGSEPTHLLTLEAFREVRALLSKHGILAINTVGFYEDGRNKALASVSRTLEAVFPFQLTYRVLPGDDLSDFVILASGEPFEMSPDAPEIIRSTLRQMQVPVDSKQGVLLTDDLNPYESFQVRKSERYREMASEWLGFSMMVQ